MTAIVGNTAVEAIEVENINSGDRTAIETDHVLIRIGVEPNTDLFRGQIDLDNAGYIVVDARCGTNIDGVFAAGDVANPIAPTISTAVGMAATAVKSI